MRELRAIFNFLLIGICLILLGKINETHVKIITHDVGYRDDIVPKAVDIAKKVGLKAGNNLPQHPFWEVAEDCCKLLT